VVSNQPLRQFPAPGGEQKMEWGPWLGFPADQKQEFTVVHTVKTKTFSLVLGFVVAVSGGQVGRAGIAFVGGITGQPSPDASYVTFDAGTITQTGHDNVTGVTTYSASNTTNSYSIGVSVTPDAQLASLPNTGMYAAPWLSGGNGANFGNQPDGQDTTQYLTSGSNANTDPSIPDTGAKVVLSFSGPQAYFGILWGSIDSYNTINFFMGGLGGSLVGSITGSDILTQLSGLSEGNQAVDGTAYLNFNADSTTPFDTVEMVSSNYAFEFDNVAYSGIQAQVLSGPAVPEPASLIVWSLLGSIFCGACWTRRKRAA
jgi:hypothetical protein